MSISRVAGRWIRWMDACGVPADHIAVVLDIDPSQVAAWLGRITRNATAWEIEQMRELRSAGYTVRAIALELGRSRSAIYDAVERGDLPAWPPTPPCKDVARVSFAPNSPQGSRHSTGLTMASSKSVRSSISTWPPSATSSRGSALKVAMGI